MNNVKYFREIESDDVALRGDPHEGLAASYDSNQITLKIGNHEIEGMIGQVDLRYNHEDNTNLFCLTAINDQDLINAEGKFKLSEDFKKFGEKAVVIGGSNITTFKERIKTALDNDPNIIAHPNQNIVAGPVDYVPRDGYHKSLGIFKKFDDFSWQREWRIAIKQTLSEGAYGELRIGSIKDICMVIDTEQLVSEPIIMSQK